MCEQEQSWGKWCAVRVKRDAKRRGGEPGAGQVAFVRRRPEADRRTFYVAHNCWGNLPRERAAELFDRSTLRLATDEEARQAEETYDLLASR